MTAPSQLSKPETDVLRVAKALHKFELEHGYISREWGPIEDVYMAMAKVAIASISAQRSPSRDLVIEECRQAAINALMGFSRDDYVLEGPGGMGRRMVNAILALKSSDGGVEGHAEGGKGGLQSCTVDPFDSGTPNNAVGIKPGPSDPFPPQESPDDRCSADMTLAHNSRTAAIEEIIRFIEDGSFLHDDAPPKRFARELVAAIRDRLLPDLSQEENGS